MSQHPADLRNPTMPMMPLQPRPIAARTRTRQVARRALFVAALAATAGLLGGCASMLGLGDPKKDQATIYAPDPRVSAAAAWPNATWQLAIGQTSAARVIDSSRIAVRPTPNELQVYKGASWAKQPTDMIEDALGRALEDSGRVGAVGRQGSGLAADFKLVMDLRRFEADYAGTAVPAATIEINAKLLRVADQRVVGTRTFTHAQPAASTNVRDVVDAFSRSLTDTTAELAQWTLQTGNDAGAASTATDAAALAPAAAPARKR